MALNVYLQSKSKVSQLGDECELIVQFEDDEGYFYLLTPLFAKLWRETGLGIDLYGSVVFNDKNLEVLRLMIVKAQQLTKSQPDTWNILIETQTFPDHREIYSTIEKQKLNDILSALETAVKEAQSRGLFVNFAGD